MCGIFGHGNISGFLLHFKITCKLLHLSGYHSKSVEAKRVTIVFDIIFIIFLIIINYVSVIKCNIRDCEYTILKRT